MTNIPVKAEGEASGSLAEAYRSCREMFQIDELPLILRCFGSRPDFLFRWAALARCLLLDPGHLERRVREAIATYVSGLNDCPHCADSHGSFLRLLGVQVEDVRSLQLASPAPFTAAEKALFRLVRKVTRDSAAVTPKDIDRAHAAGWTHDQIAEAIYTTAYFCFMNRIANSFGIPAMGLLDCADAGMDQAGGKEKLRELKRLAGSVVPLPSAVDWLHDRLGSQNRV